jgi:hypothetical protein
MKSSSLYGSPFMVTQWAADKKTYIYFDITLYALTIYILNTWKRKLFLSLKSIFVFLSFISFYVFNKLYLVK